MFMWFSIKYVPLCLNESHSYRTLTIYKVVTIFINDSVHSNIPAINHNVSVYRYNF